MKLSEELKVEEEQSNVLYSHQPKVKLSMVEIEPMFHRRCCLSKGKVVCVHCQALS